MSTPHIPAPAPEPVEENYIILRGDIDYMATLMNELAAKDYILAHGAFHPAGINDKFQPLYSAVFVRRGFVQQ